MDQSGNYIKKYKKRMCKIIKDINPDWDEDKIKKVITEMIDENIQNPEVTLDNNYTGETRDSTLLSTLDWALDNEDRAIIGGNFTFYLNQHEAINPTAKMLDNKLIERKRIKKRMFKADEEGNTLLAADLDRSQGNTKRLVNSYYGGSGMPSSPFYSLWSGPATTASAQGAISTAENLFEGFAADNYIFLDLTELMEWCNRVLKDYDYLDDWIELQPIPVVLERLMDKILEHEYDDEEILNEYLHSLDDSQVTFLYYKNNIFDFIEYHKEIQDIILDIFENIENLDYVDPKDDDWLDKVPSEYVKKFRPLGPKEYNKFVNKQYFMDPNDPPSSVEKSLCELNEYMMKYVYAHYLSFDRIYRLKNFNRGVVTVIDTDSNILSLDSLVNFIFDNIIRGRTFGRSSRNNEFIMVNMITYILTEAVTKVLLYFEETCNVCEEYRSKINMKNEFFFERLVIGDTKKRYISKVALREGNLVNPPKIDIKGFDFKKSTCSEYAEKYYEKLIKKYILCDGPIDVENINNEIREFKDIIRESILNGDNTFLPNASPKEMEAYKDPASEQSLRGVFAWNYLFPENMIQLPAKVSLVKLNIFTEDDIIPLKKTNPREYDIIMDKIFNDTTGMFVSKNDTGKYKYVNVNDPEWYKKIPKKKRAKFKKLTPQEWNAYLDTLDLEDPKYKLDEVEVKSRGMQVIAVPSSSKIPKWLDPYIDYTTLVNNILSPFIPVMEIFGAQMLEQGKSKSGVDRKTKGFSNIIKF